VLSFQPKARLHETRVDGRHSAHQPTPPHHEANPSWFALATAVRSAPVQRKAIVGAADDPLEREADREADRVLRMADASAPGPEAVADTSGRDVVFGAGQYAPGTASGRRLLAHEMAHVVQQSDGATRIQRQPAAPLPTTPQPQGQQQPNLMRIYSFGPSGAGRMEHDGGLVIFPPPAPVDARGAELVRAGTPSEPKLSRLGRYFTVDQPEHPLPPPVPSSAITSAVGWNADDGSTRWGTRQAVPGTYYSPGRILGTRLTDEFIFQNDRPGVLTMFYLLDNPAVSGLFIVINHEIHFVNDPTAPIGATVINRTPDASSSSTPGAAPPAASAASPDPTTR